MVFELFEFNSVVRGYHYYQKYWQPEENERLFCAHEADNPYDCFAIRTRAGSRINFRVLQNFTKKN